MTHPRIPTPLRRKLASFALLALLVGCGEKPQVKSIQPGLPIAPPDKTVSATSETRIDHSQAPVPVYADDLVVGDPTAKVTLVAFTDLECPFCSRAHATLESLRAKYASELRVVIKHNPLPFHNHAYEAALAAATVRALVGNDAGFKFIGKVFAGQRELSSESLERWAAETGLAQVIYREAMESRRFARKVDDDIALAKRVGAFGTPAFRINGVTLTGAQPLEAFAKVIDEQRIAADGLLAAGTASSDLYVKLTTKNFELPPPDLDAKPAPDLTVWKIPVSADDPQLGSATAPVTIVVFSDFQCPYCARVEATLKQLREKYGATLRFVWKDNPLPFHQHALGAAVLGRLVFQQKGSAAFWELHDTLFSNQETLEQSVLREAEKHHVSKAQLEQASRKGKALEKIEQTQDLALDFNARGTPAFFINGVRLTGAQPLEVFAAQVDAALSYAKKLLATGVPEAKLYEAIIEKGQPAPSLALKDVKLPDMARPTMGPVSAKVTLQLFSDFQCPFCKRMTPVLGDLAKEFPRDLRIVWRHMPLPFHDHAQLAAEAAEAAFAQKGSKAFWAFHDRLFQNQAEEGGLERAALERIAVELKLDVPKFKQALDQGTYRKVVEADAQAAKDADISGTPSASINGYYISGAQPLSAFRRAVKNALDDLKKPKKAEKL